MSSLTRFLSVGFSTLFVSSAALAEPPRIDTGLKYRQPLTLVQLESEPEIMPAEATPEPNGAGISDGQEDAVLKDLRDFFSDDPNEEAGGEPSSDDFDLGDDETAETEGDDPSDGRSDENLENPAPFSALPPIRTVSLDAPVSPGILPEDYAGAAFAAKSIEFQPRGYQRTGNYGAFAQWCAPWVAYRPLYFEDVWLERHGYDHGHLQPLVSAAKFYGRIPLLPYMVGATPHDECTYSLGFNRPGDCTPHYFTLPKRSRRGLLYQTAWVTGIVLLTP